MQTTERRVVITGLGLVCPLGIGLEPSWSALIGGRGGVGKIRAFPVEGLPNDLGGEVQGFDPKSLATPKHKRALAKSLRIMARDIQLAVAAAEMAIVDAGITEGGVDPTRIGVDLGAGLISTELDELAPAINMSTRPDGSFDYAIYGKEGVEAVEPLWLLKYLPNMPATHISILNDCQGPSNTITQAESASNVALGEAARIIARGRAEMMISGGADSKIHPLSLVRMTLLGQMTSWSGEPSAACRPFDAARGGWVPGEGAGIIILEEREHALRRGAHIYGEVLGFGSGCDAHPGGGLDPEGSGIEVAVRQALKDARLEPSAVGHVNAHAAGSPAADLAESRALARVFGPGGVPVTSLKGYMGNLVSGCGAVETILSLLGVNRGLIPPTLNCDDLDPSIRLDVVRGEARPTTNPVFVNTNLTRHGQASAVVVRGNPGGAVDEGPTAAEAASLTAALILKG